MVIYMEELYFLAFNTVIKKYSYNDELFSFYVVGLYALLCKYKKYSDIVVDSFLKTDIYFEHDSVMNILKKYHKSPDNIDEIKKEEGMFESFAVSSLGHEFIFDKNSNKVIHIFNRPYIAANINKITKEKLLNSFCHEFGHIIKGQINGFSVSNNGSNEVEFYFRTGLAFDFYYLEDGDICYSRQSGILDEVINVLQTTEALQEVRSLKEFVNDPKILNFISSLNIEDLEKDIGYEKVVGFFKELWNNSRFRDTVSEDVIIGSSYTEEDFSLLDDDTFDKLSYLLDVYFDNFMDDVDDNKLTSIENECLKIIKRYNEKYKSFVKHK